MNKIIVRNYYLIFLVVLFSVVCGVCISDSIWDIKHFPDSHDYLMQAQFDIFTQEFWFPTPQPWITPRPFAVPLFYKLVGAHIPAIIVMQKMVHFLSALLFCLAVSRYLNVALLKYLLALCICTIFCWWNILGWTQQGLSESLSFSLLFIWISTLLFYFSSGLKPMLLGIHIIVTFLFGFTRDNWPMMLLFFYLMCLILFLFYERRNVKPFGLLLLCSIVLFGIQQYSVTRGKRHRIPLFNNIAIRITENDKYLSFFTERGMPLGRELQKELAGLDLRDHEKRGIIYDLYFNDKYLPLQEWILKNGRSTYIQFMLLNPSYPLLLNEPEQSKLNIFASNLVEYIGEPAGLGIITEKLFPVIPSWLIPVLALVLLILNIRHGNTGNVLLILFTAGLAVNALLVYNADSLEQGRHLFFNSLYIEITGVVLLVSIADRLYQLNAERRNYSGVK